MPFILSAVCRSPSGLRSTYWPAMARARSWPCPAEMNATFKFARHFDLPITNIIGDYFNGEDANPTKEASPAKQRLPRWPRHERRDPDRHPSSRRKRHRHPESQLPDARRRFQPPTILGRTLSHRLGERYGKTAGSRKPPARTAAYRKIWSRPRRRRPAGQCPRMDPTASGDQYHARVCRQQLVFPAVHGPA